MAESYRAAGVDIDALSVLKREIIGSYAQLTHGPRVLGGIGGFAGLYHLTGVKDPVLVASCDGVGTKSKVTAKVGHFESLGMDIVNLNINDIVVCGARPLFFLDYIGAARFTREQVELLMRGMSLACRRAGCALIGGETAQMPDVYHGDDFDLVGFVVGVAERQGLLDTSNIAPGDVLLGLPSNGLHTNGYSLVRRVFRIDEDPTVLERYYPELGHTLGAELSRPHRPYYPLLEPTFPLVKGMAHITGGGLIENPPRILPEGLAARFDTRTWSVPPIFTLIQEVGGISREEMFRVFNMGIGMVLVCDRKRVSEVQSVLPEAAVIGEVVRQEGEERVRVE